MPELDEHTIRALIAREEHRLESDLSVGQPYTVVHFERLELIIEYLKRVLDGIVMSKLSGG